MRIMLADALIFAGTLCSRQPKHRQDVAASQNESLMVDPGEFGISPIRPCSVRAKLLCA
jgi:hypothetical protein